MDSTVENQLKVAKKLKEIQNDIREKNRKLKAKRVLYEENKIKPFVEALNKNTLFVENPSIKKKNREVLVEKPIMHSKFKNILKTDKDMDLNQENIPEFRTKEDLYISIDEDGSAGKIENKRKAEETIMSYTPMRSKEGKKARVESVNIESDISDEESFMDVQEIEGDEHGPLASEYMKKLYDEKGHDISRGPYIIPETDTLMLGNKLLEFDKDDNILIGKEASFPGTRGLFELIFMANPISNYTKEDEENYKKILILTGAHLNKNNKRKGSTGYKYLNIIGPMFKDTVGGLIKNPEFKLMENKIQYVYYTDPNQLVDRLRLLMASERAGNFSHKPEIKAIAEQLEILGHL